VGSYIDDTAPISTSARAGSRRKARVEQMSEQASVVPPTTTADVTRSPLATVEQQSHVAAAAYLMKHAGASALMVLGARTGQPAGIIMEADIAHAIADGKDVNSIRVYELMTACST
jgi:signal-transduction protein with cAMP-binding, CBS, and nucleotidyltransferase domain